MRILLPIIFLVITIIVFPSMAFAQESQPPMSDADQIYDTASDSQWKNHWVRGNYYNSTLNSELQVFKIPYKIMGGNVLTIVYDDKSATILIQIESNAKGKLIISIPRNLPVTNMGLEEAFPFIIVDGEEAQVSELKEKCYRTFSIPFEAGTEEIELIGTLLLTAILPYGLEVPDDCIIIPSPRLQIKMNGVPFEQIRCNTALELIFKKTDASPVCVKPETKIKLIERWWGTAEISIQKTWVEIDPIQCGGNPWEKDWLESHPDDYLVYARLISKEKIDMITNYYKKLGITIFDTKLVPWENVAVCESCSCPAGYTLSLLVSNADVDKMREFGYKISENLKTISVEKSQQIIITNNDSTIGQTFNKAFLTINKVTIHSGNIEYLPVKKGFITLAVDYSIKNIDNHSYSAHLLFEGVVRGDTYPYQLIGGGFDTALLPHETRSSYVAIQVV
ncbi:MAG: hypothetical protein ACRD92_07995, partial [Nitrosopumilaceae archaeon]